MKFGFIGAGNMVSAIVRGMVQGGYNGADIALTSKTIVSAEKLAKECGANAYATAKEVAEHCDILVLGVKPHIIQTVLPDLQETIAEKKITVVSIAAGKSLSYLAERLPKDTPVIRVMPNINGSIGKGTTGICQNEFVSENLLAEVQNIFEKIGSVFAVPEEQFGIFSVLAGAAPAFAYIYTDTLARAAVKAGMPKPLALAIAADALKGSGEMLLATEESPWALVDKVCSPGGTTIEGVTALSEYGFMNSITKAFDAVLEKDKRV